MKPEWDKFWEKLSSIAEVNRRQEWNGVTHFLKSLDNFFCVLFLSGGLKLPFQKHTVLNTPHGTHDIPRDMYHDIPHGTQYTKDGSPRY